MLGQEYYWSSVYGIGTLDCLDYLGMGALLALVRSGLAESQAISLLRRFKQYIGWGALVVYVAFNIFGRFYDWNYVEVSIVRTTNSIFFVCLIYKASKGFKGIIGKILEFPVIVYLGRISYGLYVYHLFALLAVPIIYEFLSLDHLLENNLPLNILSMTIWTIGVSSISWFLYEKPINKLKKYFPYY